MAADINLWKQCLAAVPKQRIPPHALPLRGQDVDGNRVFFVDANIIKLKPDKDATGEHPHMDFVEGANDMEALWVRREFGKRVLIIDVVDTDQQNAPFILYHEAHERRDMAKGMSYDKAHGRANAQERQLRIAMREHAQRSA